MRDRQRPAASARLVGCQVGPECLGVVAVIGRERQHLPRALRPVAEDDVAVQVVAARARRPFEADEGGEDAGIVIALGIGDHRLPDRGGHIGTADLVLAAAIAVDPFDEGVIAVALPHHLGPAAAGLALQHQRIAAQEIVREADILGMIRNHHEIERPQQLEGPCSLALDHLAARDPVGLVRPERRARHARIRRPRGVQVGVAEIDVLRIVVIHIGGIRARRGGIVFLGDFEILGKSREGQATADRGKHGAATGGHLGLLQSLLASDIPEIPSRLYWDQPFAEDPDRSGGAANAGGSTSGRCHRAPRAGSAAFRGHPSKPEHGPLLGGPPRRADCAGKARPVACCRGGPDGPFRSIGPGSAPAGSALPFSTGPAQWRRACIRPGRRAGRGAARELHEHPDLLRSSPHLDLGAGFLQSTDGRASARTCRTAFRTGWRGPHRVLAGQTRHPVSRAWKCRTLSLPVPG